jgi:hypothetical protein
MPAGIPSPDWDAALDLLRRINGFSAADGRRIAGLVTEDGFEPWWYTQDRLLRFFLVPLTQILPWLERNGGKGAVPGGLLTPDTRRVLDILAGSPYFGLILPAAEKHASPHPSVSRTALFLLSLAALAVFRWKKRDTVFYIVDHVSPGIREDFRFTPLYRAFAERGVRFAEYAHTLSPRQAFRNFLRRRRMVFFLESADVWARFTRIRIPEPEAFLPADVPASVADRALWSLVPVVLQWCVESAARQRMLVRALRRQRARRAVVFDDNRHNHELIAACRSLGIPVLGFQHGVFNRFHAGLMAYGFRDARSHGFDRYGVWSELFRERLLRDSALYRPDQLFAAGPVRGPSGGEATSSRSDPKRVRVLVVSEPLAPKKEVIPYLRALLADPGMDLYLKLRPGESEHSLQEYGLPPEEVHLLRTETVFQAMAEVDVAVGTYSTVLYEAALADIPAVWMKTSRAYGRELAEEGLADAAENPERFPEVLRRAAATPAGERERRRKRIWGEESADGAHRLVDELEILAPYGAADHRRGVVDSR